MLRSFAQYCRLARIFSLALVTSTSLLLSSCGFHLRGAIVLPESLSTVSIQGTTEYSDLGRVLYNSLRRAGVSIVPVTDAGLHLQILKDEVQRRVLSVDASGKANEYELKHLLRYTATDRKGVPVVQEQDISTTRAYRFDPNSLLAKGDEEQKLRKDIIRSSAQQMLRQLSAAMRHQVAHQNSVDNAEITPEKPTSLPATPATK